MPNFLISALAVGLTIALIAGPLGSFAVWRRMAYFGDTLAHSALIGVALGLFMELNTTLSIVIACGVLAALLVLLENKKELAADTVLGVLSHGALALGLVCISLYGDARVNLFAYLFGDFLAVSSEEVFVIFAVIAAIAAPLIYFWRPLLMISIDEDLARVEGRPVTRLKLLLMMMMAVLIALAMKIVGVMLITALLIIPAASARPFTRSPEAMAIVASIVGMLSVCGGLALSYFWDIPAGPAVVVTALVFFVFAQLKSLTVLQGR